ncbi:MAG: nucleotidyltransferase family protein [Candidatus Heimdallarchaeaceae archaeon]|jgi:NDP-sugar pyrophosphorylase family protein
MDTIILCGGLGTRIRTVTQDSYPKAMIQISGKTILEWELSWLRKNEVKHAILAVRYLADYIEEQYGNCYESDFGEIEVSYSREREKLGSGGAVKLASPLVTTKQGIIMNGDIMTNFDLHKMMQNHQEDSMKGTIAIVKMRSPYGIVETDDSGAIFEFKEKPMLDHWIHAGVDIFETDVLQDFPNTGQMEETIFEKLAENKQLRAYNIDPKYYWKSIDNPKDFQETEKDWKGLDLGDWS